MAYSTTGCASCQTSSALLAAVTQTWTTVWDFVTAEDDLCRSSWIDAIRHAFQWLGTMILDFPAQEWACAEILQWVQDAPSGMSSQIRRFIARYLTQEQTIHHVAHMHRDIKQMCQQHGVVLMIHLHLLRMDLFWMFSLAQRAPRGSLPFKGLQRIDGSCMATSLKRGDLFILGFVKGVGSAFGPPNVFSSIFDIPSARPTDATGGCLNIWIRLNSRNQFFCPTSTGANIDFLVLQSPVRHYKKFLLDGVVNTIVNGQSGKKNGGTRASLRNSRKRSVTLSSKPSQQPH